MLMLTDVKGALEKATYEKLLEMFEAVTASYYMADSPEYQEEIGKIVIAVAAEAHTRGKHTCNFDLSNRDALVRNAVIRATTASPLAA